MPTNVIDPATLQAALVGYQIEKESIERKIAEIRKQLGQRATLKTGVAILSTASRGRKPMSAAAKKRIAAAQKKRWAAYRKDKAK